jgi:hypothetical protein
VFFRGILQRILVLHYRRFGKTYRYFKSNPLPTFRENLSGQYSWTFGENQCFIFVDVLEKSRDPIFVDVLGKSMGSISMDV